MRAKLILLSAFVVGTFGGSLASGCQTYDFEPVEPLALAQTTIANVVRARALKPNMMLLLDTSGSMTLPANTSDPDCRAATPSSPSRIYCGEPGNEPCNVNTCPTRWSELRSAMGTFLSTSGTVARLGLTTYPAAAGGNQCSASSSVRIPVPQVDDGDTPALQSAATQISDVILGIPLNGPGGPVGGTPTSMSLRFVGEQADLQSQEREDFVLLLTDGLPNCNPNNPNGGNATTCRCTQSSCTGYPALLCLDKDASVAAVTDLQAQRAIRTIVIGFGADFNGTTPETQAGAETLNAMAVAGNFPRSVACTRNEDCGASDTCDLTAKVCNRRFYLAGNQAELARALEEIINRVSKDDVCLLKLDPTQRPTDDSLIVVYVNDQPTPRGDDTWTLNAQGVQFQGSTCTRIRASTDANPIRLEVRAVQRK
jgi:hypothetical protein